MIKPLLDDDGVVCAAPALRLTAYIRPGVLATAQAQRFLDGFFDLVGPTVTRVAGTMISRQEKFFDKKPKHLDAVRAHWREPVTKYRPSEARFFGPEDGYTNDFPWCVFVERRYTTILDICISPELDVDAFIGALWEPVCALSPTLALCGFAIAPDPLKHAQERLMALRAKRRYQMAWCMHAEMSEALLEPNTVANYNEKIGDSAQPGIPDVGWKTVVGGPFLPQIDPAAIARIPGVSVRDVGGAVEITVGPEPRWGDANVPEDVTAYAAVCRALAPIRASKSMLRNRGIFADADDLTESVEAYYRLWEA